jgi:hypothetical protein
MNTFSCLSPILACIVYRQASEISRVLSQCDPVANGIDFNTVFPKSPRLRAIPPISLTMVICCNNSLNFVRSLAPSDTRTATCESQMCQPQLFQASV